MFTSQSSLSSQASPATKCLYYRSIVQLPAQFMVWANWDVDELKSQAQEIQSGQHITSGVIGGPFQHMG
jgi:hypothetical protein